VGGPTRALYCAGSAETGIVMRRSAAGGGRACRIAAGQLTSLPSIAAQTAANRAQAGSKTAGLLVFAKFIAFPPWCRLWLDIARH
jgi:hypothetical protein